jgi:TRAP-type C4-dicarboxylate transport system substrate-binding protein
MKNKIWLITAAVMIIVVSMIFVFVPACAEKEKETEVFHWRMQTFVPPGGIETETHWPRIISEIEERTGGRLQIEFLLEGAAYPFEGMFDAVAQGGLDAINFSGPFFSGVIPVGDVELGLPMAFDSADEHYDLIWNGGLIDIYREAYMEHNIYLAGLYTTGPMTPLTNFPVSTVEDFQGHTLRATFAQHMLEALGVAPVVTSYGEMYLALERGTVDGTYTTVFALEDLQLMEVVDYVIYPAWTVGSTVDFLVNLDRWNELPSDIQEIVEGVFKDLSPWTEETTMAQTNMALDKAQNEYGVTLITLPPEEVAKLRVAALSEWQALAERDPYSKRAVDLIIQFNQDKGRLD